MERRRLSAKSLVICLAISAAVSFFAFISAPVFEAWEHIFLDWHLNNAVSGKNDQKIALILGGDRSMIELDSWPWPRETHAELLSERLGGAKVVALDIFLVDKTSPEQDEALSRAIAAHGNVVLGNAYRGDGLLLEPLEEFSETALTGYFSFYPDSDYVVRRYPLAKRAVHDGFTALTPSFVLSVLEAAGYMPLVDPSANSLRLLAGDTQIRLDKDLNVFKLPVPEGAYSIYEYADVLRGDIPAEAFEDAVVFIGISATGAADNIHTSSGYLAGTEVLADVFYSILSGKMPRPAPDVWQLLYCFVLLSACLILAPRLPDRLSWLPLALCAATAVLLPHFLFRLAQVYLKSAALSVALVLCGVLQIFYLRVLRENRRRQEMLLNMIGCLVSAIDAKDPVTAGHSKRVSEVSAQIAAKKGMKRSEVEDIRFAGLIHDIGKIGIPDSVLNKPGRFTPEEYAQMRLHPEKGIRIMESAGLPEAVLSGILDHHEQPDGRGYPNGKRSGELSVYAEIIKIADVYDALISKRQYKEPWPIEKVCDVLYEGRGSDFNAELLDLFLEDIRPPGWKPGTKAAGEA